MSYISKVRLPSDTEYDIRDGRLPEVTASDVGKILEVNSDGQLSKGSKGLVLSEGSFPEWTAITLPSLANWASVTYGNGKFVAVAAYAVGAYSADGITWTAATMSSSENWISVTYGNGEFVAVAYDSTTVAYSADGITWTAATMPSLENWTSVTYGNGKFVAVAYDSNTVASSIDGIHWAAATMPSSANWDSVTYGNGKFVAITYSNRVAYSMDGITWTEATLPSYAKWPSLTYGNGKFVAVAGGNSTTAAAYSIDGINWTAITMPSSSKWYSITFGNGKFVAAASDSNEVAYSADGIAWTLTTLPSSAHWISVTYGNGKFVVIGQGANKAAYSTVDIIYQDGTDVTDSLPYINSSEKGIAGGVATLSPDGKVPSSQLPEYQPTIYTSGILKGNGSGTVGAAIAGTDYAAPHKSITGSLSDSGWTNNQQTMIVPGITANDTIIISPAPASVVAYGGAGIYASSQTNNTILFECTSVPSSEINVNIVILG